MTAASLASSSVSSALRRALLIDAAASGGMGLLFVAGHRLLAGPLGLPMGLLFWAGLFLLPFASFLIWIARQARVSRALLLAVVIGNVLWGIASIAIIPTGLIEPTTIGTVLVLGQAAVVALFAAVELRGIGPARSVANR